MYRSIIVPVDGSARSQAALPAAAALAHASGATLDVVRVHLEERPDLADDPSWDQMFREGEMRYLEALALAYEPVAGTKVTASLLDPPVAKSLLEFAETRAAPLFVMIGRGRTGLRRALLGSTCDALIRGGDTPVLVLRDCGVDDVPSWQFGRRPFRRIVLPLDGTLHAEGGIAHAAALARAMNAKLRLVRVVGPIVTSAVLGAIAMHPMLPYDDGTLLRNDIAQEYLQGIVDRINGAGPAIDIGIEVALGTDPATALIESCRRMSADLVVLPTHGRGASRILVSAVGDRLLRDGPDAMLFVKPPHAKSAQLRRMAGDARVPTVVR